MGISRTGRPPASRIAWASSRSATTRTRIPCLVSPRTCSTMMNVTPDLDRTPSLAMMTSRIVLDHQASEPDALDRSVVFHEWIEYDAALSIGVALDAERSEGEFRRRPPLPPGDL